MTFVQTTRYRHTATMRKLSLLASGAFGGGPERKSAAVDLNGHTDPRLHALFRAIDTDGSGSLSIEELSSALRTNPEFAQICGADGSKPLNLLSANLIAQNLRKIWDTEFGDGDGNLTADEFCMLCRKLAPAYTAAASSSSVDAPASATGGGGGGGSGGASPDGISVARCGGGGAKGRALGFFSAIKPATSRSPEARLGALHSMLREEVITGLEALLDRASNLPDDADRVAAYHRGVCDTLSACRRLVDGNDETCTSVASEAAAAEQDAVELHRLRRELASAKVALAEAESAKAELTRAVHGLEQQAHEELTRRNAPVWQRFGQ